MTKYERKDYSLSKDGRELIKEIQKTKVVDGKPQFSGRVIDAMIKKGAIKRGDHPKLPKDFEKGGFH